MNQNKVVIVILLILVGLFLVSVLGGSLSQDQPHSGSRGEAKNLSKQESFTTRQKWFDDSLGWLQPKAKLPCGPAGELSKKCENLQQKSSFQVLPDDQQSFRKAKFRIVNGTANVCYRTDENAPSCTDAKDPDKNAKPNFEAQSFDLPDSNSSDPSQSTVIVTKKGGKITVICQSLPCRVDLE